MVAPHRWFIFRFGYRLGGGKGRATRALLRVRGLEALPADGLSPYPGFKAQLPTPNLRPDWLGAQRLWERFLGLVIKQTLCFPPLRCLHPPFVRGALKSLAPPSSRPPSVCLLPPLLSQLLPIRTICPTRRNLFLHPPIHRPPRPNASLTPPSSFALISFPFS